MLLIILILVIRLGAATSSLANIDVNLLMIGTCVGFSIIVSAIILNHILGGNISILEVNIKILIQHYYGYSDRSSKNVDVRLFVRLSVRLFGEKCPRAHNLHLLGLN